MTELDENVVGEEASIQRLSYRRGGQRAGAEPWTAPLKCQIGGKSVLGCFGDIESCVEVEVVRAGKDDREFVQFLFDEIVVDGVLTKKRRREKERLVLKRRQTRRGDLGEELQFVDGVFQT